MFPIDTVYSVYNFNVSMYSMFNKFCPSLVDIKTRADKREHIKKIL